MRPPNRRFGLVVGLVVAIAIASLLALTSVSQAQRGGGFRGGSMGSGMSGGGMRSSMSGQRFHSETRFRSGSRLKGESRRVGKTRTATSRKNKGTDVATTNRGGNKGRRPGKGTEVTDRGGNDGRPNRRPTRGPRPGPRDPNPGPGILVGTGVGVGTGVVVGTGVPVSAGGAGLPPGPAGTGAPPSGTNIPPQRIFVPPANENRFVKDEVVLAFAANFPQPGVAQLLSRHGLVLLESQNLTLSGITFVRARISNRRAVRTVLRGLGGEVTLRSAQANYLYAGSQQTLSPPQFVPQPPATPAVATAAALPKSGDPAQYALEKLHLNEAHNLATGDKVLVAVIDSGIDLSHPELAGAIAGSFDALGKRERSHMHGTAIAGAIVAHARLLGAAPAARILAIRAFSATSGDAEATTFAIVKGVEYAVQQNARVINMSFAGPADPALSRELAGAKAKGAVLIAASGNYGPKSPPQYPAADPNVIAVSATDADDKLFKAANIGPHIALTAPGVDILLPVPDRNYEMISGTSFAAAYVSGVAALLLQRAPGLDPDAVRQILMSTAKDLGPAGKDPQFGAGLVDALSAITAVQANAAAAPGDAAQPQARAQ